MRNQKKQVKKLNKDILIDTEKIGGYQRGRVWAKGVLARDGNQTYSGMTFYHIVMLSPETNMLYSNFTSAEKFENIYIPITILLCIVSS